MYGGRERFFDSIHNAFKTKKKTTYLIIKRRRRSELNQIVDLSFSSTTKKKLSKIPKTDPFY